jgi:RimJ/RimL family protein N-acetyltransferase
VYQRVQADAERGRARADEDERDLQFGRDEQRDQRKRRDGRGGAGGEREAEEAVECGDAVVGYVSSFVREGLREVAYWYGREHWGKGIATEALRELLAEVHERPLFARVAMDHTASRRVLEKVGFRVEARESTVESSGDEVEELLLRLD